MTLTPDRPVPADPPSTPPAAPARPPRRTGGLTAGRGLLTKICLLAVVDALAVYGVMALWADGTWTGLAAMVVGTVAINYVYVSRRALPLKYLAPGLVFLLVFQVYVVLYTGYAAFTNYGDGHNSTKSDAIAAILATNETRVPDSAQYPLAVALRDGKLAFLVTDPKTGEVKAGTADDPLQKVAATTGDDKRVTAADGYQILDFAGKLARQNAITTLRVPLSDDPKAGSVRTSDGSTGFAYRSTFKVSADQRRIVDSASGTTYTDTGDGYFRSTTGKAIEPGWKVGVGFSNFTKVLSEKDIRGPFIGVLLWTFSFAILSVLSTFILGLVLALTLNEPRMRGQRLYRSLLILPYAVPVFLAAPVWAALFNRDFGFVNQNLLGGAHIEWLTTPWLARLTVLIVNLWLGFPYMFLVCTGALQSLPMDVMEAARVDGASAWRILRSVKLPLLLVTVAPLLISSFAFNFNNFNLIYLLTGGGPKDLDASVDVGSTDILISFVYKLAFGGEGRQYGFACALSIMIFVIVAITAATGFRKTSALEELN